MKKRIFYIPIEPLEERYTKQWYDWFYKEFDKSGFDVITIDGKPLNNQIEKGSFLDINSTVHYKSSQLMKISKLFYNNKIQDGDIFFVSDIEFWGIESIKYLADLQNKKIKLYGFCHAASYTTEDYMEKMSYIGEYLERAWFSAFDKIFTGSNYHKNKMIKCREIKGLKDKIVVVGYPIDIEECKKDVNKIKKKQIILPNRFDYEKRPNISLDLIQILKERNPDLDIIITTSRKNFSGNKKWLIDYAKALEKRNILKIHYGISKKEYYKLLAESKVMLSTTIEEGFGCCIMESLVFNTYPVCENKFSHPELLENDNRLLFNDLDEVVEKIEYLLNQDFNISMYADKYKDVIKKIIEVIKNEE